MMSCFTGPDDRTAPRNPETSTAARLIGGLCAVVVALMCVRLGGATPSMARADAPEHRGFTFSPGTCEQGQEFCAVAVPRTWTQPEIDLVRAALDQITTNDLGQRIAERARQNGFRSLRRFGQALRVTADNRYEAEPLIVATTHVDDPRDVRTSDLTDSYFDRRSARDTFSGEPGYLLTTEILAHELVHAMDLHQRYSGTAEFRRVARLGMPVAQQRIADQVNIERAQLNGEGRYEAAWQASRSFALITMRGRFPSVQSLDGYREAFAEFGAHLVLDPNARRRLEPRPILYFERAAMETPSTVGIDSPIR